MRPVESPRRHAGHNGTARDIPRHHRAGADKSARADAYASENDGPRADGCPPLDQCSLELPVRRRLQLTPRVRRGGMLVVDEHNAVADEDLVFDGDAVTDERVALDLAARADDGSA